MTDTLRDYQVEAVDFLRRRGRAGLFLDMGLGKTCICLSALEPRRLPALVVAPKRVAEEVWPVEAEKWRPDLRVASALEGPEQRAEQLARTDADLFVIKQDTLAAGVPQRFKTLIIDELSGYKSRGARWKAAKRLTTSTEMEYVWGLTGTPAPNGLLDLFTQVYLLDSGHRLGKNITAYRSRYFTPGRQLPSGVVTEWLLREGAEAQIHHKLDDLCLSMKSAGRVSVPPVTHNLVTVRMPPRARKLYSDLRTDLVADVRDLLGEEVLHSAATSAALSARLSQVAAGFIYGDDMDTDGYRWTPVHDEKIKAVQEIVDGTGGSPVLVAYRFQAEREMLLAAFPEARTPDSPNVFKDWNAGSVPMLVAHPGSMGHGLNLQHGGHTAIWTSPPWPLEHWDQLNARLPRPGQKHPVVIHTIIAKGTIDLRVRRRLTEKDAVQTALLDHLESLL